MPLAEARSLAPIHFEQHDPLADQTALLKLAELCEQFSPIVGMEPPDNLCLDVTGIGSLFGGEEALARQVMQAFQQQGLVIQLALADTLGAAWGMAHFGKEFPQIVPPGESAKALAGLPIAALRLTEEVKLLSELGIDRIGQLLPVPRDALVSRFGPQLLRRLDQALGLMSEIIVSHRPPPDIVAETELEFSTANRQAVDILLSQLIDRVAKILAERQQGAIQLQCQLLCEVSEPVTIVIGLFRASAHAQHLRELTRLHLERITLPAPVTAVKLSVLTAARLQTWQQELFDASQREGRRQVGLLIDRLSNRLGREAVLKALPQSEAQPEFAYRYEPLAGALPRKTKPPRWKALPRPLRLEREPIALEVLSVVPDGPPFQFQFHGSQRVAKAWGPERIQTGWWRGRYIQRDYYRVETESGQRFWLFRRLSDGQWFLHGVFD
jgi:protein ImuB